MKQTYDTLRSLYLADLSLPDIHHGRTTPKVRNIAAWEAIVPKYKNTKLTIDPRGSQTVWVWSDIHFGHKNIIKYTEPHRPFSSWQEMNDVMIANYNQVVQPDDIVIWGGDIGFMPDAAINNILDGLPGYKIHIVGNHDMDRSGKLKNLHFDERHLSLPVDVVDPDGYEYQLLFTHYPLDNVPANCQNIHGHIHDNVAYSWNTNICVEHTNCAPAKLSNYLPSIRQRIEGLTL